MSVLAFDGVHKAYGRVKALNGISLSVEAGEFVALLGPNGAGKSTLFQLLTGLFAADSGDIRVAGEDLRAAPVAALRHIGVVFQQATLDLDLSVEGNLRFFCRLQGVPGPVAAERIDAALVKIGLADRRQDRVRALSGGNRRKVELVRALLHRPRVLLMDEPTVGLDPASRHALLEDVHALCREQAVGVLWATHLVEEAEPADRVIVMHQGRKLAEGAPAKLVTDSGAGSLAAAFLSMTKNKTEEMRE
ncbi:MAG: ATP-binding cassette domain-containing protein [Gammaproteobacteria bacterium]|nr:ATP-binding cassette domain-containing protein [Gammaproteobacteria bacterium]